MVIPDEPEKVLEILLDLCEGYAEEEDRGFTDGHNPNAPKTMKLLEFCYAYVNKDDSTFGTDDCCLWDMKEDD
jgi:hypothetical protein